MVTRENIWILGDLAWNDSEVDTVLPISVAAVPDKGPANVFATDSMIALAGREVKLKCLFSGK